MHLSIRPNIELTWPFPKRLFFWFHYALSWIAIIIFGYLILAPLLVEGPWSMIKGVYAAIFFKTDQFEWANGTVIVISILYACYAFTSVLFQQKTWLKYSYLSDGATILALVYISRDVYQIMLMMTAVIPWWIIHRWVGRFVFKESKSRDVRSKEL